MDATCPDTFTPFNVSLATRRLVLWLMKRDRKKKLKSSFFMATGQASCFPHCNWNTDLEAMTFFKDLRQHTNFENWKPLLYSGEKAMHELCWDHQYIRHLTRHFIEVIQLRMWSSGNNNNSKKKPLSWLTSHNLPSVLYKSCCHPPPTFLFISLLVWLNLESEPNNEAPTPKKNPTAAEQNPAEEPGGKHE